MDSDSLAAKATQLGVALGGHTLLVRLGAATCPQEPGDEKGRTEGKQRVEKRPLWLSLNKSDQKGQPTLRPQKTGNKGSVPGHGTLL